MKQRINIAGESPWEEVVGYSRAVVIGNRVEVSGTTAVLGGEVQCPHDIEAQTRVILNNIASILEKAGSSMEQVVRTRIYVTDISAWEKVGKVHGEYFGKIKPAATMVEVSALIDPALMVEIEVEAVLS